MPLSTEQSRCQYCRALVVFRRTQGKRIAPWLKFVPSPAKLKRMGRFASTVEFYARYREPYPPKFFQKVAEQIALGGDEALLDIGCGPCWKLHRTRSRTRNDYGGEGFGGGSRGCTLSDRRSH